MSCFQIFYPSVSIFYNLSILLLPFSQTIFISAFFKIIYILLLPCSQIVYTSVSIFSKYFPLAYININNLYFCVPFLKSLFFCFHLLKLFSFCFHPFFKLSLFMLLFSSNYLLMQLVQSFYCTSFFKIVKHSVSIFSNNFPSASFSPIVFLFASVFFNNLSFHILSSFS